MDHAANDLTVGNALSTQRHEEYPMKKKLLSLAIAGASIVAAHSYAAGPTVYGKLNVSLNKVDTEKAGATDSTVLEDTWKLRSNESRFGIMGDAEINKSLKAIYKLEFGVGADGDVQSDTSNASSTTDTIKQRNIYAGLQSSDWGTLLAGRNDTPLRMTQGTVDEFNDMYLGDLKYLMVGEDRESDTIMYQTPNMSGFTVTAAIMPGEQTKPDGASGGTYNDGPADYASIAAEYKTTAFRVAAGYDSEVENNDVLRLVGEYFADQFQLGFLYQTAEAAKDDVGYATSTTNPTASGAFTAASVAAAKGNPFSITSLLGDSKQDAWILSGAFKANDKLKIKAEVGQSTTKFKAKKLNISESKLETQEIALGVDYALAPTTTVYAYLSQIDWDFKTDNVDGNGKTYAVGIEQKF